MEKVKTPRPRGFIDDSPKTPEELREAIERWLADIEADIEREREKEARKNAEKH